MHVGSALEIHVSAASRAIGTAIVLRRRVTRRQRDEHLVLAERVELEAGAVERSARSRSRTRSPGRSGRRAGRRRRRRARRPRGRARRPGARRGTRRRRAAPARCAALGKAASRSRPARTVSRVVELCAGEVEPLAQGAGVAGEDRARGGRAHAARPALEQRRARLALQRGDRLRDGGRRVGERAGGGGHRALARRRRRG